jgi:hypothetical protein
MWHIGFWWSMAINHSFEDSTLNQESVICPSTSNDARSWLLSLHDRWIELLSTVSDEDLLSSAKTRWPFQNRPFADVIAWVNIELTKNASELGYARFLYATRPAA